MWWWLCSQFTFISNFIIWKSNGILCSRGTMWMGTVTGSSQPNFLLYTVCWLGGTVRHWREKWIHRYFYINMRLYRRRHRPFTLFCIKWREREIRLSHFICFYIFKSNLVYRVEFMIIVFGCEKCLTTRHTQPYCNMMMIILLVSQRKNKTMDVITLILNYKELMVNYTMTF